MHFVIFKITEHRQRTADSQRPRTCAADSMVSFGLVVNVGGLDGTKIRQGPWRSHESGTRKCTFVLMHSFVLLLCLVGAGRVERSTLLVGHYHKEEMIITMNRING